MAAIYRALLLDFYGTLVEEDEAITTAIVGRIAATSPDCSDPRQIGRDWRFAERCRAACGDNFRCQRTLELESLAELLRQYRCDLDPIPLAEQLFAYWRAPRPFDDAARLLQRIDLPVCLVSNIDADDLRAALDHLGWRFPIVVSSEECRSYKPDGATFRRALELLGCAPADVLHVGDSLGSDVAGAHRAGIDVAWINRKGRTLPAGVQAPTFTASGLDDLYEQIRQQIG